MHFEKYGINQITKLFEHYTREHITENVVQEKIKGNQYYFNANAKQYIDYYVNDKVEHKKSNALSEYCNREINDRTTRKLRADSVVMIDLIITQPEYLGKELDQKFFDTMQDTLKEKYIKENNYIMSAIHQDEQGQPHMHFSFIPIVQDKKKNSEKLCAKEFLTKDFLKTFHQEMEKATGYKLTSEDKNIKNLTMQQYQNKKDIEKLQENIKEQEQQIEQLKVKQKENEITISKQTQNSINYLEKEIIKRNNGAIKWNEIEIKDIKKETIPEPPTKKNMLGNDVIDTTKINDYVKQMQEFANNIYTQFIFNLTNIQLHNKILSKQFSDNIEYKKSYDKLNTDNIKIKSENEILKKENANLNSYKLNYENESKTNEIISQAVNELGLFDKIQAKVNEIVARAKHHTQNHNLTP